MITRTSTQLLADLYDPGRDDSWTLFSQRYRPIVVHLAQRRGLQPSDAEDVAQETMTEFLRAYRAGNYDRARGTRLRDWLKGIAANRVREFQRKRARGKEHQPPKSDSRTDFLAGVPDENAVDEWESEWVTHILSLCMAAARREFDERTSRAFERYAIEQHDAGTVAQELDMSRNAVYIAKSRVLARLHQLFSDLDDPLGGMR